MEKIYFHNANPEVRQLLIAAGAENVGTKATIEFTEQLRQTLFGDTKAQKLDHDLTTTLGLEDITRAIMIAGRMSGLSTGHKTIDYLNQINGASMLYGVSSGLKTQNGVVVTDGRVLTINQLSPSQDYEIRTGPYQSKQ